MRFDHEPETNGGGKYLRIQDGESLTGVFRGQPQVFCIKWQDKKKIVCSKDEPGARFRFTINFVYKENGALVSKIWEQGPSVYNMLKEINKEYTLERLFVKISRSGTGIDTEYSVMPMLKKDLMWNDDFEQKFSAVPLQDLAVKTQPETTSGDSDEELPF